MAIRPLDDRIVVQPLEAETKSAGGIVLPGTVVAVGVGRLTDGGSRVALTVKVGDQVLYGKYAGTEIKYQGDELKILRESEVLGLFE